jgi:hypothetical protein
LPQPALRRRGIGGVGERNQLHALLLANYLQQVLKQAPKPVELVDVARVAGAQPAQQLVEFGLASAGPGDLFLVDELAAGLGEGIELEGQVLVAGRDAGLADVHRAKYRRPVVPGRFYVP